MPEEKSEKPEKSDKTGSDLSKSKSAFTCAGLGCLFALWPVLFIIFAPTSPNGWALFYTVPIGALITLICVIVGNVYAVKEEKTTPKK